MEKDFQRWHEEKSKINVRDDIPRFNEMEIWFCALGANVGCEEDGKGAEFLRPIVILKKFSREMLMAIPLTRTIKTGNYYFPFLHNGETSVAMLWQTRIIDARRLQHRSGILLPETFCHLTNEFLELFKNKTCHQITFG
jgi:mRNA-degrading endonuclease toxin of MazEF toxin-antitoxin module